MKSNYSIILNLYPIFPYKNNPMIIVIFACFIFASLLMIILMVVNHFKHRFLRMLSSQKASKKHIYQIHIDIPDQINPNYASPPKTFYLENLGAHRGKTNFKLKLVCSSFV